MMKLERIKKAIEELSDAGKREFFSEVIPEICDESLTKEACRIIFERKLSGSLYQQLAEDHGRKPVGECPNSESGIFLIQVPRA
jgi:hypothetical protein